MLKPWNVFSRIRMKNLKIYQYFYCQVFTEQHFEQLPSLKLECALISSIHGTVAYTVCCLLVPYPSFCHSGWGDSCAGLTSQYINEMAQKLIQRKNEINWLKELKNASEGTATQIAARREKQTSVILA